MLRLIEGFETFGAAADQWAQIATKYSPGGSYTSNYYKLRAGRWGGFSLELSLNDTYFTTWPLTPAGTTPDATWVVGFNFYTAAVQDGSYANPNLGFWDDTQQAIGIILRATGELSVYRGSTLLGTTTGADIQAAQWNHIEIKAYCHATAGEVWIRVNGAERLHLSGMDTQNGGSAYNRVRFQGLNNTCLLRFDDIYILDATGSANNDFLGRKRVVALFPDAAGDLTQWTPSAGANYACVDEQNPSTADYVETAASGNMDLYNFTAIAGAISGGVCGVQINVLAVSTSDGVPWQAYLSVKPSGGAENDGDSVLHRSSSGQVKSRILETNPTTSVAWTVADLDSAQFGVKLV